MDGMFVTVTVVGILAVVSPGPDFLIVTRNSLLYSKKVGLATALGIAAGNIWWIAASLAGISYALSQTVLLFALLKWMGALYLMYLGACSLRAKKKEASPSSAELMTNGVSARAMTSAAAFRIGLLTNVLNPKCALFFVSFFSVVVTPETPVWLRCAYGGEIMLIAVTWFSLLAVLLSVRKVKGSFERFSVWLERITGAILIALGLKLALSRD